MDIKKGKYKHFKGGEYEVMGVARDSENPENWFVVYRCLYNHPKFGENSLWIRPKKMFLEHIKRADYEGPRFVFIGEST